MRYTVEEIGTMSAEELRNARQVVSEELRNGTAEDYTAIVEAIEAREAALAERRALVDRVNRGLEGTSPRPLAGAPAETRYTADSEEYRRGFLRMMLGQEDSMTREERAAVDYVATTTDTTNGAASAVPTVLVNRIWDMIDEQHVILDDITMYRTGTVLEMLKRTGITQGDAKSVGENEANDDEINTFATVKLVGKDFSKHINITYAMQRMSIDAFETFLVTEVADRMGAVLAAEVIAQLDKDMDTTNKGLQTAAAGDVAFKDVATAMSYLKYANGQCVVYATRATIYKHLVGMVDANKRPIFQLNAQEGAEGTLIGCPVRVEDAIKDDVLYIGYPQQVIGNMIQDIMIESDRDIKKHVVTYAAYARFECVLIADKAFVKLSVKSA